MDKELRVAAVVLAGYSPDEKDLLAEYTRGGPKALLPIAGRPMLAYAVDALQGSRYIKNVVVVGLPSRVEGLNGTVEYVPGAGGALANAEAGLQYALDHWSGLDAVLIATADVPTCTPAIIDAFIEECFRTDHDLCYAVIERSVMEKRFPGSRRSYVHLREGDFCGGDFFFIRPNVTVTTRETLRKLTGARKNALRQARMVGFWTLFKLLIGRLTLADAERAVGRLIKMRGRVIVVPYAEMGMDVDKPFQYELVRAEIEARAAPILP